MKRMVILAMVLALSLGLAAGAQAAGFPPKSYCYGLDSAGDWSSLSIKNMASIPTSNGSMKMYAVHGSYTMAPWGKSFPVSGTGYVSGGSFHFSVTGAFFWGDWNEYYVVGIEGFFDSSLSGHVYFSYHGAFLGNSAYESNITSYPCNSMSIPYDAQGSGQKGSLADELKARSEASKARPNPQAQK